MIVYFLLVAVFLLNCVHAVALTHKYNSSILHVVSYLNIMMAAWFIYVITLRLALGAY